MKKVGKRKNQNKIYILFMVVLPTDECWPDAGKLGLRGSTKRRESWKDKGKDCLPLPTCSTLTCGFLLMAPSSTGGDVGLGKHQPLLCAVCLLPEKTVRNSAFMNTQKSSSLGQ